MEHICMVLDVRNIYPDGENKALLAIEAIIKKKLFFESKDEVALIYGGTLESNNPLFENNVNAFKHISIISELNGVNWDLIKHLSPETETEDFDLLEAIHVAVDHLIDKLKERRTKGKRRIIVFSDLGSDIDFTEIDSIADNLKGERIELSIVSNRDLSEIENDEPEIDEYHEKISSTQLNNERQILKLSVETGGNCFSYHNVLTELSSFEAKSVAQRGWKVNLQVSNVFTLSVVGYVKIRQVRPPPFKILYGGDHDATIETKYTYHLNDAEQTQIQLEDTIKGYKYGKSIVPCNEDDSQSMKLEVEKSLILIGFTEEENAPHTLFVGDSSMFFVVDDEAHAPAFTSLVYAMYENKVVALVRKVYSKASSPQLGVLIPRIKSDHVSLVYSEIAFGEGIRTYSFASLLGTSGNSGNGLFTDDQITAIDDFIDHMMLVEISDEGKEKEVYKPSSMKNPALQYFYQCVQSRCFKPKENLPELSENIMSTLAPPKDKIDGMQPLIDFIKENFPLKPKLGVPKKKMDYSPLLSYLSECKKIKLDNGEKSSDFDELFEKKITEVGPVDPIGDFQLLVQGQAVDAVLSMQNRIWQLINDSYMATFYPKALQCLQELRKKSIECPATELNLVGIFNSFLKDMKEKLKLLLSKKDFWKLVIQGNINLISQTESDLGSDQSEVEAFLLDSKDIVVEANSDDDMNALFDDM